MITFSKKSIALGVAFTLVFGLVGLVQPTLTFAATSPSLGNAGTYSVLSSTFTRDGGVTALTGDLGYTTLSGGGTHTVTGTTNIGGGVGDAAYQLAGTDQGTALANLNGQACTFTFASGAIDLATDTTHGTIRVYTPGVYCTAAASAATIGTAGIILRGAGTFIFKVNGALTSVANSSVTLENFASSCDVFWAPTSATTLGANTTFKGTMIDASGITVGTNTTWLGRALAFGGTVLADADSISSTCAVFTGSSVPARGGPRDGSLTVVKSVINDNMGTKLNIDFPLFVNGSRVFSGSTNSFVTPASYTVTETQGAGYTHSFSGDCDSNGVVSLVAGDNKICIITNNDIGAPVVPAVPPLIDVVKVPSPLALPMGPGPVTYTYTIRNIGTVPVTNITMVGDTCSPIVLVSGDNNLDGKLGVNEVWVHRCSTVLQQTHTNTVTATGWANGISSVDVASATVVVGASVIPPIIHLTKIPSSLSLSAGGGTVIYMKTVTNPGIVPLENIRISDDKCSPVNYISGDSNSSGRLDQTEIWLYTCTSTLRETTTNTAIVRGDANGLTARDVAVATVVVAIPGLPNAGFPPEGTSTSTNALLVGSLLTLVTLASFLVLKKSIA